MANKRGRDTRSSEKKSKALFGSVRTNSSMKSTRISAYRTVHSERVARAAYVKVYDKLYNQEARDISETVKYMKTLLVEK